MPNHDMGEIIAGGAPWEISVLCRECGCPYTARTFSSKKRNYTGPPFRFGVCRPCVEAEDEEYDARQRELEARRRKKEPKVPVLEEDKLKQLEASLQSDAFDPFEGRKDTNG